eukprot:4489476-Pyramimonas_sp.AAC.1
MSPEMGRPVFLELFAGSERLLQAILALTLSWGEAWDLARGREYDLLMVSNLERLFRRLRRRRWWWIHMAPPCSTFSRARRPPLRSPDYPWGLLGLSPGDAEKAQEGSTLCVPAVQVALFCIREGIYFVIENP